MRQALGLIVLAAAGTLPAAAPPMGLDDAHDLVLLRPERPYRVRFHLSVEGRPFRAGWDRQVGRLFAYLDRDGDGRLSPAEAARAPDADQWRQLSGGKVVITPEKAPEFVTLSGGRGMPPWQTCERTTPPRPPGRSRPSGPGCRLRTRWPRPCGGGSTPTGTTACRRRAAGGPDGPRTPRRRRRRRHFPGGAMGRDISFPPPIGFTGPSHGPARGRLPFLSLRPGAPGGEAKRLLTEHYGKPRASELEAWLGGPPDLAVEVPLDAADRPAGHRTGPAGGLQFTTTARGESFSVGDWVFYLSRTAPPNHRTAARGRPALEVFRRLDTDSNGYLDRGEVYRPPFAYVAWLRLADVDGDGRVTAQEFTEFWDLMAAVQGQVPALRVESQSRSLFRLLDQDGDGRLGVREVAEAWDRVRPWCRGGHLDPMSLPYVYRVTVGLGAPRVEQDAPPALGRVPPRGPLWFRKMDRNGDGDVSRKEWLGSRAQFDKLDRDGDGLISLEEAARADRRP
ncbi:MAG: hypothetical protein U0797_10060 [Gemmataceae bacterium]